jgi:hypothetical protein
MGGRSGKGGSRSTVSREIVRGLRAQGWVVVGDARHYRCVPPVRGLGIVFVPRSPSDNRSLRNTLSELRRSGADLTKLPKG